MQERGYTDTFDPATATLVVSGAVAEDAVLRFEESIRRHLRDPTQVLIVDLSDVDFFPSAAVSVLAGAFKQTRQTNGRIELVSSGGSVAQRVLQICGMPHQTR